MAYSGTNFTLHVLYNFILWKRLSDYNIWIIIWVIIIIIVILFSAIRFAPGGNGPYTTQLQQNTYNINKYTP
jgi:uncharacterized protein YpmB